MRKEDLFKDERAKIERALETLERIGARFDAGEPPPAETASTVAFLTQSEEAAYEDSQMSAGEPVLTVCVEEHEAARLLLSKLTQALDARERGETAAGRIFAQQARDYVQLRREHMKRDDRLFSRLAGTPKA